MSKKIAGYGKNDMKITSIIEGHFMLNDSTYEGYTILCADKWKHTTYEVYIGIEHGQDCCEVYGYLTSLDNMQSLVGQYLHGITVITDKLEARKIGLNGFDEDGEEFKDIPAYFINLEYSDNKDIWEDDPTTSKAQIVVYNYHNGYYGHKITVKVLKSQNSMQKEEFGLTFVI